MRRQLDIKACFRIGITNIGTRYILRYFLKFSTGTATATRLLRVKDTRPLASARPRQLIRRPVVLLFIIFDLRGARRRRFSNHYYDGI